MSASDACKRLFPLIKQINNPHEHVETVSKADTAYLVSADEWRSLDTAHLPRSPNQHRAPARSIADLITAHREMPPPPPSPLPTA